MCDQCWGDGPIIRNDRTENALLLMRRVYDDVSNGACGGYGHIVFDDNNIEDGNITWCIDYARTNPDGIPKEEVEITVAALQAFLELTEDERESVLRMDWEGKPWLH